MYVIDTSNNYFYFLNHIYQSANRLYKNTNVYIIFQASVYPLDEKCKGMYQ